MEASQPAYAGDSGNANVQRRVYELSIQNNRSAARFRGLIIVGDSNLGFRCASPQALCFCLLRRLVAFTSADYRFNTPATDPQPLITDYRP
jgi:hypothetical protein